MTTKQLYLPFIMLLLFSLDQPAFAQKKKNMVRIAEITVHPQYLTEYKEILKQEAEASMRLEPGVLSIFPMYTEQDSSQIRILEIYADQEAYQSHLKTPHFLHYKNSTLHMVKALKLIEMAPMDPERMPMIFKKIE